MNARINGGHDCFIGGIPDKLDSFLAIREDYQGPVVCFVFSQLKQGG
jgi:hypothetical protein